METELGPLTSKWRVVELEIGHEERVLADCRAQKPCPKPKFLLDEYGVHRFERSNDILLSPLRNATGERTGAHTNSGSALGELRVRNKRTLNVEVHRYRRRHLVRGVRR